VVSDLFCTFAPSKQFKQKGIELWSMLLNTRKWKFKERNISESNTRRQVSPHTCGDMDIILRQAARNMPIS
jgi:hypothetical protein